jgi:hypothetical protein
MPTKAMTRKRRGSRLSLLAMVVTLAPACGGSQPSAHAQDGGAEGAAPKDARTDTGESSSLSDASGALKNVMPVIVNRGLPGSGATDEPFVSVTLCTPGTSKCQTIDDVLVDTGSTGLRIMASALSSGFTLPTQTTTAGGTLVECEQFGGAYQWGSVRLADVLLGGEVARKLPVHIVGDPAFTSVPAVCSSCGPPQLTPAELGANGLLGISTFVYDCGVECASSSPLTAFYYSCTGTDCTVASAALDEQITNPIALLETDNNGALLRFPPVSAAGAMSLTGQLIFGIGTQPNNGLGDAKILKVDASGYFTTVFDGQTMSQSYIDSGTNQLSFDDAAIPTCAGQLDYLFCPSSPLALTAQNQGIGGVMSTVTFEVENASSLFAMSSYTAFDDIAGPGGSGSFVWGFPFFIGRSVYVGLLGKTTPGGERPFFAY